MKMKWNFKEGIRVYAPNYLRDLTYWGAINPEDAGDLRVINLEDMLADQEQAVKLRDAMDLVRSFERTVDERISKGFR